MYCVVKFSSIGLLLMSENHACSTRPHRRWCLGRKVVETGKILLFNTGKTQALSISALTRQTFLGRPLGTKNCYCQKEKVTENSCMELWITLLDLMPSSTYTPS